MMMIKNHRLKVRRDEFNSIPRPKESKVTSIRHNKSSSRPRKISRGFTVDRSNQFSRPRHKPNNKINSFYIQDTYRSRSRGTRIINGSKSKSYQNRKSIVGLLKNQRLNNSSNYRLQRGNFTPKTSNSLQNGLEHNSKLSVSNDSLISFILSLDSLESF